MLLLLLLPGKPYGPIVRTDLQQPPRRSLGYLSSCLPISIPSYLSLCCPVLCCLSLAYVGCHCRCCCCCFAYFSIKSDLNTLLGFSFTSCAHTYRGICHYIYIILYFFPALAACGFVRHVGKSSRQCKRDNERERKIEGAGRKKIEFYNKFCTGQKSLKIGWWLRWDAACCLPRCYLRGHYLWVGPCLLL